MNNLKEGWETKKLGEICQIKTGKKDVNQGNPNGNYPFFTCAKEHTFSDTYSFDTEALLIAGNGDVGTVSFYKGKFEAYQRTYVLYDFKGVDAKFLFRVLDGTLKQVMSQNKLGNTMPYIKLGMLKEFPIPIPSLPEQQQIVSILDKCFAAINKAKANAEQNLKNAKELFESYLQKVFENGKGWEMRKLKDIALVFGRGKSKHRPRNWEGLYGGDYPFIQTGEIRNANKYVSEYRQTYNKVGLAQSKLWEKGTICITIAANIAETAILGFDACIPDSIIGLRVDSKKADLGFTYYLLQYFKDELQKLGKGSAQDNINLGTFENQFFPFPKSIFEQQSIACKLDALRTETQKLEETHEKKIASLDELKKSILKEAFSGKFSAEASGVCL